MTKLDPRSVRFALSLLLSLILAGCGGGASQSNSGGSPNPSPALSSIAPQRATAGSAAVTLALTGTGFLSTSQVQWNGSALATTYGSATSLTALVPTADLSSVGTASVTVTNPAPGGGTSSAATFTVDPAPNPAPSLSTITPATALAGSSALTLTLTGTGFLPTSQVQWNGSALATTYGSATSLTALVPTADLSSAGTASVTVTNPAPGGGISSAATFTVQAPPNPAPRLSTIAPASVVAGSSGLTLTVTGTGFLPTSQIQWNGSALATNYGSPASLTAQIPSADLLSAGSASVTVSTPAPGGGLSGALTFSIKAMSVNLTVLPIEGRDLSWNASQQKLYVAVPASAASYGSTITVVDPIAGTIGTSRTLASEPSVLAISADDSYLYAAINDGTTIQRLTLPALTPDIQWSLGNNALESAANAAAEIQVQPGAPHTLAVAFGAIGYATDEIALYDDAHLRAPATCTFCDHLQWKPDGSELFASSGASDTALYTFSVNAAGLSPVASYASALLTWTHHLHLDAASGYLYTDLGKVVDPSNGLPIAQYGLSWSSAGPNSLALAIANPATRRYFVLQPVATAGGGSALQIQSYDMDRLTVESTIQIANVPGIPANFITWGQSGLAFVTRATSGQPDGQLYILDGTFVNPSGALDTTAGTALTPLPTLTAVTPLHATIGSGNITVTLTGHDFTETTTAYLNGNSLSTTPLNSTQVQAAIPASALTASTTASLTLSNTTSADAVSNALPFTVDPAPPAGTQISEYDTGGNSLVWDSKAEKIYVSMPANQGSQGNAIATVDPVAGTVATTGFIGSDPAHLVLSSDGQFLDAALLSQNALEQFTLPGLTLNKRWSLGADPSYGTPSVSDGPYRADGLAPAPGAPQTLAVLLATPRAAAAVRIYDATTPRPSDLLVGAHSYDSLQWGADPSTLYAVDPSTPETLLILGVGPAGASLLQTSAAWSTPSIAGIHYDAGLIYADSGQVIDPASGKIVGNYGASGLVLPDSTLNTLFILGQTAAQAGTQNYTLESFNQKTCSPIASLAIDNLVGAPTGLIRWGSRGLAFTTSAATSSTFPFVSGPGRLYIISSGSFVSAADAIHPAGTATLQPVHQTWVHTQPPPPPQPSTRPAEP